MIDTNSRLNPLRLAATAGVALALTLAGFGCAAGDEKPGIAPVPEGLTPRPDLDSVPANAVRVAVFQGGGEVSYDLVEGQRYFLVNETSDVLLSSDVADGDGELTIGEDGATLRGNDIWEGTVDANDQVGLYVNRQLETP